MTAHPESRFVPYKGMKGVSSLYATYCEEYTPLASFFGGDWRSPASYEQVAEQLDAKPIPREQLVSILTRQNKRWSNESPVHQLEDPRALTIVTGQQVGIFGGPLYTLYKAVTAIKLARRLAEQLRRPVVPVFWLEGGDHDIEEVSSLVLQGSGDYARIEYRGNQRPTNGNLGSVGSMTFNEGIARVKEEVRTALPASDFRDEVLERYYSAYRPGVSFTDAFAQTISALLGEYQIVLMDPEDCDLKELAAPIMRREIKDHEHTFNELAATTAALQDQFHAQVHVRPFNLFVLSEHGREAVQSDGGQFRLKQSGKTVTLAELLDLAPCLLSPNVVMRPLVQDYLLPTLSYVAGPGEIAYFAQFKSLYDWAGRPMPVVFPRSSVTLLEPRTRKVMQRYDLDVASMNQDLNVLMRQTVLTGTPLEQAFDQASDSLADCAQALKSEVARVEHTLGVSADATLRQWQKELTKLQKRVERAEKNRHDQVFDQLRRCQNALYPQGHLQERTLPVLEYLARYGESILPKIFEGIDVGGTGRHQILPL